MSANDPKGNSSESMTRKQRRAAERTTRKSAGGGSTSAAGTAVSSGPSMLLVSIGAILIGLVAVVALVLISGGVGGSNETSTVTKPDVPAAAAEFRDGRTLVKPGATPPVRIDAYEDPQCPACGMFTERIEPLLIAEHVASGLASFTYNDFVFLGDESWDAAVAMRVAEDMGGKFWDYQQALFHNQDGENQGGFRRERLADIAELVGLDRAQFLAALDKPEYRDAVEAERAAAVDLTVNSTPTLVVNGELIRGVPTWESVDAIIREAAAAAST